MAERTYVQSRIGADGVRVEYPYTITIKGTGKKGRKLTPFGALKKEAECMTDEEILKLIDYAKQIKSARPDIESSTED